MADIWFISDTHFFHDNIIRFTDSEGNLVRPGFETVEQMNDCIVTKWNETVKPNDKVWHLGDVAFKVTEKRHQVTKLLRSLNGNKRMLLGNHDNVEMLMQTRAFEKIELWKGNKDWGFTCSHIPLMLSSLRDGTHCVHGHIHQNLMANDHYINVCVEHTNYKPVHLDTLIAKVKIYNDNNIVT